MNKYRKNTLKLAGRGTVQPVAKTAAPMIDPDSYYMISGRELLVLKECLGLIKPTTYGLGDYCEGIRPAQQKLVHSNLGASVARIILRGVART